MQFPGIRPLRPAFAFLAAVLAAALLLLTLASSATSTAPVAADRPDTADDLFLPQVAGPAAPNVLIAAAHIDSAVSGEPDEALLLWNGDAVAHTLAGWEIRSGARTARVPLTAGLVLAPGAQLWCARDARGFRAAFGMLPACEWDPVTDLPAVPNLDVGSFSLVNGGSVIQLRDGGGRLLDTLVYGDHTLPEHGWQGRPAQLYSRGAIPASGQVWQRKRDPLSWRPLDTDQAGDWAGDPGDLLWGRRVRFPGWTGWGAADNGLPLHGETTANVTLLVGPEGLYPTLAGALAGAQASIDLSIYTLEHPELAQQLADAARRGVQVRLLLEGGPPGGISDLQRWCVAQVAAAGVEVRYMAAAADAPNGYRPRYSYLHAKYVVVDGRRLLVGTDNFNWDSAPVTLPPPPAPVGGRRGFFLWTDAPPVVAALATLFQADWATPHLLDLRPFQVDDPRYGGPPADFVLPERPLYSVETAPFVEPLTTHGPLRYRLVTAPENALHPGAGLADLLAQAGPGDAIHLMQLYEHKYWGGTRSNPVADPNPRLEALLDAARRGAQVRILLDDYFDDADDPRGNRATVAYVQAVAAAEGLDLDARVVNPTGGGIHAKLVLVRLGHAHWSGVGSLNGGEVSHKVNREVLLLVEQGEIYARLLQVFERDWGSGRRD